MYLYSQQDTEIDFLLDILEDLLPGYIFQSKPLALHRWWLFIFDNELIAEIVPFCKGKSPRACRISFPLAPIATSGILNV